MNVLSLFDGMSCAQIALSRAGITVDNYFASEIDKFSIKVCRANYPSTIQVGSVKTLNADILPHIDLLIGGSPCQGFSSSGKQGGFEDERSKLFFEFVRLRDELIRVNPQLKYLLENVKMSAENVAVISRNLGVHPVEINSSLLSAQNRQRLYWTNIGNIPQPKDRGILLPSILEHGVTDKDKSYAIDANYAKGGPLSEYYKKGRRQVVFTEQRTEKAKEIRKFYRKNMGKDYNPRAEKDLFPREDDKANCITTCATQQILIDEAGKFRKLTPVECERLQTVPDNYTNFVSNTQRYKMLGNGFTVDVIAYILGFINSPAGGQLELF